MSLLIAFASYRRRGDAGDIFYYRHDGKSSGELLPQMPTESPRNRSDYGPWLSDDGRYTAFSYQFRDGGYGSIALWDRTANALVKLPGTNPTGADAQAYISGNGRWMVFAGWQRPGGKGGHDIFLYDMEKQATVELPGLNTEFDEQMPTITGDGRWIVFTSNRPTPQTGGVADRTRLYAYDREKQAIVPEALYGLTPGNCRDTEPAFSSDGRYLAFASDRPTPDDPRGAGDIHLYDFRERKLVPLPGLNSFGHDCQPGLSRDGRYLVFTSERLDGAGQRDIYLYDRAESKLLPTPGLNTNGEEYEPAVAVVI